MARRTEVELDLAFDRRMTGSCYWKMVEGVQVRVRPQDVIYVNGNPRDAEGTLLSYIHQAPVASRSAGCADAKGNEQ